MSVVNGCSGAIDGIGTVRTWTGTSTADLQAAVASNTKCGEVIVQGNEDWNVTYNAYGDTPAVMPGDTLTFSGSIDGVNGIEGPARVASVEISWDQETGAIIAHTVNLEGNGEVTKQAVAATDTSTPDMPTSIDRKIEIGTMAASPVWSEIPDVRTITLTITSANQPYNTSTTGAHTKRTGGVFSATVSFSVYTDDYASLPDENDEYRIRLYTSATEYWLLQFVRFQETGDIGADIEGAGIVAGTLSARWSARGTITTALDTEGQIVQPDTTVWWP